MNNDLLMRDLSSVRSALDTLLPDGSRCQKWFISFGSLLYLIRDKKRGIEFNQDIDISILGQHQYEQVRKSLLSDGFQLRRTIVNDITGEILYADFESRYGLNVDLFFWVEHNGYFWHTYDYMNEKKPVPTEYHFKGTPTYMMIGGPYKMRWFEEMDYLKVPKLYGTLLDYWYPHWFIPDSEFGVSRAQVIREFKSCENLEKELHI